MFLRILKQLRYILLISFILKYYKFNDINILGHYSNYMMEDLHYCQECFQSQINACQGLYENLNNNYQITKSPLFYLIELLPKEWRKREIQWLSNKENPEQYKKLLYKYVGQRKYEFQQEMQEGSYLNSKIINLNLNKYQPLSGTLQYCRAEDLIDFSKEVFNKTFRNFYLLNEKSIWLYISINIEPILMAILYEYNFPVSKTFGICGFSMIQNDAGKSLEEYRSAAFSIKLTIALKLLEASVQFTYGLLDKYRIYVTDLTARNIFYNEIKGQLLFIDLDSIFLVKSETSNKTIHRYEYIDCPGCLAFVPSDLCSYDISDLNIYTTCRFLHGDLFEETSDGKGFLSPWPSSNLKNLMILMQKCIDCPWNECQNRLIYVKSLLKNIQNYLTNFN